jgi:hypothetical protein
VKIITCQYCCCFYNHVCLLYFFICVQLSCMNCNMPYCSMSYCICHISHIPYLLCMTYFGFLLFVYILSHIYLLQFLYVST